MSTLGALIGIYARSPRRLPAHMVDAIGILRRRGVAGLRREIDGLVAQSRSVGAPSRPEPVGGEDAARALLERLRTRRAANAAAILSAMREVLTVPSALMMTADPVARLRGVEFYLYNEFRLLDLQCYGAEIERRADRVELIRHYLDVGRFEGRRPNFCFDPLAYVSAYPDVTDFGWDPLAHYALYGWREGRVRGVTYRNRQLRVGSERIEHRKRHREEIRRLESIAPRRAETAQSIFETLLRFEPTLQMFEAGPDANERLTMAEFYLFESLRLVDVDFYSELIGAPPSPHAALQHYLGTGRYEGARPNPYFDPIAYVGAYPDVTRHGWDPLIHYTIFGWREGRRVGVDDAVLAFEETAPDDEGAHAESSALSRVPFLRFLAAQPAYRPSAGLGGVDRPSTAWGELDRRRGVILVAAHDAELGGAQSVARQFGRWLLDRTRFDVRFVLMKGGPFVGAFEAIAPTFVVGSGDDLGAALRSWAGGDVCAIFVNSVASGGVVPLWDGASDDGASPTPVVAFIHELPKILDRYEDELKAILARASCVVGGSDAVRTALRERYGAPEERLAASYAFVEPLKEEYDFADKQAAKRRIGAVEDRLLVSGCGVAHWRKSPDIFVEVAAKALAAGLDAEFVWYGGGPDEEACKALAAKRGVADRVRFAGYEPDVPGKLAAADIFLLTSQEDPFPLVCLNAAQALAPVICFEDAGGMPEFVARGCGRAVRFGDADAMARALLDYAGDPEARRRAGERGRALVEAEFTVDAIGPQLLHRIRRAAGLAPELSVVVPNYNYEAYLPERLDSIAAQTFQDFEVILLDDQSRDESVAVLRDWAARRPDARLEVNRKNSGSPFAQWLKGIAMASAPVVWIAEADDFCAPDFAARLLPAFDDRNVFFAHAKSTPVDAEGAVAGDYEEIYLNRINEGRWSASHLVSDHEEANEGLGIANAVPNASAVMLRRFDCEPDLAETLSKMRLCGDWLFYLRAMRGGWVAYDAAATNFHRRHDGTVTKRLEGSKRYFDELATVRRFVDATWRIGPDGRAAAERFFRGDEERFGRSGASRATALPASRRAPGLLVVASDLSPGGGQMFSIRLANEWVRRGRRAVLVSAAHFPDHPQVAAKMDPRLPVISAADGPVDLPDLVRRFDVRIAHSAIWWADVLVAEQIDALPADLRWIVSMHGCHETLVEHPRVDPHFRRRFLKMLGRVDAWVYTAEKNRAVFDLFETPALLEKIDNGVPVEPVTPHSRAALGLREDALVLCLATRAIREKGWFEAVDMVERMNAAGRTTDLMLIGEGRAADELRARSPAHVHFYGQVPDLQRYIGAADIGLLPSYFIGESLPLVVLEMMARGKPVVATDRGELPHIVGDGPDAAGVVVPLVDGALDAPAFAKAVESLRDGRRRATVGRNAARRFEGRYTLAGMVNRYDQLYQTVLSTGDVRKIEAAE